MNKQNNSKAVKRSKRIGRVMIPVLAVGFLALSGCGETAEETTVTDQPAATIESTVTDSVDEPEVTALEDEQTSDIEPEEDPIEENRFPDATVIQTGDRQYTFYIDCPDNSGAEVIGETVNIHNFDLFLYGANKSCISENIVTAIAAYGMQIDSLNCYQINYDAYMDKPFSYYDSLAAIQGEDPHVTVVIPTDRDSYPEEWYIKYTDMPNDFSTAEQILRNCLDETHNIELALLRYYAGPDAFDQVMDACSAATGFTREEICEHYGLDYVLKYDTEGVITNPDCVRDTLQYVAVGEPIVISYFDYDGNTTEYTYVREDVKN